MTTLWNKLSFSTSTWKDQFVSPPIFLLKEDGFKLLQEDGYGILLEQPGIQTWNKQTVNSSTWSKQTKN